MGTKKKSIIMFVLAIVLVVMGIAYAAVSTVLSISGTANLEATWNVAITGISEGTPTGKAYNKATPSYVGTNASFNVGFKALGDKMDYEITITNNGSMDAIVSNLVAGCNNVSEEKVQYISYVTTGIKKGDIIESGDSKVIHFIVDFPKYITPPSEEIEMGYYLSIDVESYTNQEYAQEYKANDRVMLDDGNMWRILKPSNSTEENILLIKEEAISNELVFDENEGHDFNTSTLKTYLNTTYKDTLPDSMKSKIVGDIVIPTAGDYTYQGDCTEMDGRRGGNCILSGMQYTPNDNSGYMSDFLRLILEEYKKSYKNNNIVNIAWMNGLNKIISRDMDHDQTIDEIAIFSGYMYMLNAGTINATNYPDYYLNPFGEITIRYNVIDDEYIYENFIAQHKNEYTGTTNFTSTDFSGKYGSIANTYPVITINKSAIK